MVDVVVRVVAFAAGAWAVMAVVRAAVWTVVVPRPEQVWLTRVLFLLVRRPPPALWSSDRMADLPPLRFRRLRRPKP